jgi:hypothetical protein
MSTTIEALELEILSSSESAESGLTKLTSSLNALRSATKGGLGLTSVVRQLQAMKTATSSINASDVSNVTGLANAIRLLGGVKISSTIAKQITELSTALTGANFTGGGDKVRSLVTALEPLSNLPKNNLSSYVNSLKKLPDAIKALDDSTLSALTVKIQQLVTALRPLGDEMQKVANGFSAFPSKIQKLIANTNELSTSNKKASTSYMNLYAKLRMVIASVKTIASKIASAISEMNSYVENINLFTVAMGDSASAASNFAESVGEIMGIDPGEWMRNQGIFMTLATGFGVAGDRAAIMSQQLTQLGYDLSSFFNIGVEEAMQKLQSGISGELEPLRRLGYDLSQAKLEATALSLGIDKTVSSMTQAEKAQLRYYAIMTQVTSAQGDMARTLNSPANQLRIFKAQVTQAARAIGSIFIPALNAILPYAIAVAKVIRILASVIASLFGFELPAVDYSGIDYVTGGANDATDALDNATQSAKELKSYMLGFDELNVINPNEGAGGGGSGGSGGGAGVGLDFELPTYDFIGGATDSRIAQIVEDMKEWLGITEDIDTWSELMDTRLGNILTLVGAIGTAMAAWKIATGVGSLLEMFGKNPAYYSITLGIILSITGMTIEFAGLKDAIKNGLGKFNFGEIVGGGLLTTGSLAVFGAALATWIDTTFASSTVAIALTEAGINLGVGTVGAAGAAIAGGVGAVIAGIPAFFVGIYDAIKNGLNWLNGLLIPAGSSAAGAGIALICTAAGTSISPGVGTLVGLAVGLVTEGIILIIQEWDKITAFFSEWSTKIQEFAKETKKKVTDFFKGLPDAIKKAFDSIGTWVDELPEKVKKKLQETLDKLDELPEKIKTWFDNTKTKIADWFDNLWQPIRDFDWYGLGNDIGKWFGDAVKKAYDFVTVKVPEWWNETKTVIKNGIEKFFTETLPEFFTETIPQIVSDIADFFEELPDKIKAVIESVWDGIVGVGEEILNGIFEGLNTIGTAIKDFVTGFIDGFKEAFGIHSPSTEFRDEVGVYLGQGLLQGILNALGVIRDWCKEHIIDPFNRAMDGALEFFVDVHNDAVEWWNNVKTWWSEKVGSVKDFVTQVKDDSASWWNDVKTWWDKKVGMVTTFTTRVRNEATTWWNEVNTWWGNKVGAVAEFKTGVKNQVSSWWGDVQTWWEMKVGYVADFATNVKDQSSTWWQNVKNWWYKASGSVDVTVNAVKGWTSSVRAALGIPESFSLSFKLPKIGIKWGEKEVAGFKISFPTGFYTYAQGGFPDMGQMFIAREAGPELVGTIGNRSAVVNNDQIVESVSLGVYQAVVAALGSDGDSGGDTQIVINLDGEKIYENQQKVARNRGYSLGMGAFSFG